MAKKKTDTDIVKVEVSYEQLPDDAVNYDLKNADIESLIRTIRGQKVMVDFDLAMLYGVKTKALNQAVKRNIKRFPDDFMFQLTNEEWNILRSQIVTAKQSESKAIILLWSQFVTAKDISKIRTLPYAFTREGIGMLSSVLGSDTAIEMNIRIMRVFTAALLSMLDKRAEGVMTTIHSRYYEQFQVDLKKHNEQYPAIDFVQLPHRNHDRFLIIDDKVYFMGASLKDMGAGLCAVTEMAIEADVLLGMLK